MDGAGMKATFTIGGVCFRLGDLVDTPDGRGRIAGLDPLGDQEIGVQFSQDRIVWYAWTEATPVDDPSLPPGGKS